MESCKSCILLEEHLGYLSVIKVRSECTIMEYRTNILMFFTWLMASRGKPLMEKNFSSVDANLIKSITLNEMYAFLSYYQKERNACAGSRARKIVSIRQFWKYLKKVRVIHNNVADELETPKIPKRISKFLSLEESVRLLIAAKSSPRDHCLVPIRIKTRCLTPKRHCAVGYWFLRKPMMKFPFPVR